MSLCGLYVVDLNGCLTGHGSVLEAAAKFGLPESAKEVLDLGYMNMLTGKPTEPNTWPLVLAVKNNKWQTVKVILLEKNVIKSKF